MILRLLIGTFYPMLPNGLPITEKPRKKQVKQVFIIQIYDIYFIMKI
jgi:hypothetical protein